MTFYTVYEINGLSTVFPGYVKSMTFYTVYDINVFVQCFFFFFFFCCCCCCRWQGGGTSKSMTFYTVYEINILPTVFPGYVKIDDVLHRL